MSEPTALTVLVALGSLGMSADEIATSLVSRDLHGISGSSSCCPIARFLKGSYGGTWLVGDHISQWPDSDEGPGLSIAHVPQPVADFIARFDDGRYPELDESVLDQLHEIQDADLARGETPARVT